MAKTIMSFKNKLRNRIRKLDDPPRSLVLKIVLEEINRFGNLQSSIITDDGGLIISENLHPLSKRDHLSAASALSYVLSERIADYLGVGTVRTSQYITKDNQIWIKTIHIQKSDRRFVLMVIKSNTIYSTMTKSVKKILGKVDPDVESILEIASDWIIRLFKD